MGRSLGRLLSVHTAQNVLMVSALDTGEDPIGLSVADFGIEAYPDCVIRTGYTPFVVHTKWISWFVTELLHGVVVYLSSSKGRTTQSLFFLLK